MPRTGPGAALTAFELIGETPLDFALKHTPGAVRPLAGDWPWHVLMEISSGRSAEDARALIEDILSAGLEAGFVGDAVIAASLAQAAAFWKLRESLSDAQRPEGASIKHDISVPVASIPEFIERGAGAVAAVSPRRARRLLRPYGRRQSALQHLAAGRRRRRRPSSRSTGR